MRSRSGPAFLVFFFFSIAALGCNLITGIGNLTFGADGAKDGGPVSEAGAEEAGVMVPAGSLPPSGLQIASASNLFIHGITSDGFVAYADLLAGSLYVAQIEEPDGGAPPTNAPVSLGAADPFNTRVDGQLVEFFPPSAEVDAGPSHVGALSVWSAALGSPKVIASDVVAPDPTNSYVTVAASSDGQYVAYFGPADPSGATASLSLADTQTGATKVLVSSVDVIEDACEPKLAFNGPYLVASYCAVSPGGRVSATLPDGGTNHDVATVSRFDPASGQTFKIASSVSSDFGIDPAGAELILFGPSGLVSSAVAGSGGLVPIDDAAASATISGDGKTVVYVTATSALKRASTAAPANPTQLVASAFDYVDGLSNDGRWVIGGNTIGAYGTTGDAYLASAIQAGTATTLSSATNGTVVDGTLFTTDSKFALFYTDVTSDGTGALSAYAVGGGGSPIALGTASYWLQAATGSTIVFNVNTSAGQKADLELLDLSKGTTPTLAVSQADEYFLVTPAGDAVVYTYSAGGGTEDGLWVLKLDAICTGGGAITYHPPAGTKGSCSSDEVAAFDTSCVANGDVSATCATLASVSTTCFSCLVSDVSAPAWGVVVSTSYGGGIDQLNSAGCYAQEGEIACAAAFEAQAECEDNTCAAATNITDFNTCRDTADTTTCSCFVGNEEAACSQFVASSCNPQNTATFQTGFEVVAPIMCE
jgi:hypothetical protein